MPITAQFNYNTPIGFSRKNGISTKGGSVQEDKGLEERLIECFVEVAQAFKLPRSVGEIFGVVYGSPEPVSFDFVRERLNLSKASTSTGLKDLQRMGVIHSVYIPGDLRTYYRPEENLDEGFRGLVGDTMLPHLKNAKDGISQMEEIPQNSPLKVRVQNLEQWDPRLSVLRNQV